MTTKVNDLRLARLWMLSTPYTFYHKGLPGSFIDTANVGSRISEKYKVTVLSPILNGHPMCVHGVLAARDQRYWQKYNAPLVEACGGCIVAKLDGWQESDGVRREIADFKAQKKMVVLCDPETLELELA